MSTGSPPPPPHPDLLHVLECPLCFVVTFPSPHQPSIADVVAVGLPAAVRADEQHPADEGPAGEDV